MNSNKQLFRSPLLWTLVAGLLVGAGSVMSFPGLRHSTAMPGAIAQQPQPTPRQAASLDVTSMAALKAMDASFAALTEFAAPAVVHIRVQGSSDSMLGGKQMVSGEGSGFIFRPDGYIVTNDHVAGGFDKVKVILHDGREFDGKVIRAEESDVAVVKIDAKDLPTLQFANSSKVKPGEFAMAIGAPFGLDNSVTIGHVSATGRVNRITDARTGLPHQYGDMIQTDAQINMGNSGGPLINVDGQVIGINTAIFSATGTSQGIGFAISSDEARMIAETLIEKGKVERGFLGVGPETLKEFQRKQLNLSGGAILKRVDSDSPAAMAGLKLDDVVVRIGTIPIMTQADLRNAMFRYGPGSRVPIEVVRDGQHKTFEVTLVAPKADTADQPPPQAPNPRDGQGGSQLPPGFDVPDIQGFGDKGTPKVNPTPSFGRPQLGVGVQDLDDKTRKQFSVPNGVQGAVVGSVMPGSVADTQLGIQPGDVVTQFGDTKVVAAKDLVDAVHAARPGEKKTVKFSRYSGNAKSDYSIDVILK